MITAKEFWNRAIGAALVIGFLATCLGVCYFAFWMLITVVAQIWKAA